MLPGVFHLSQAVNPSVCFAHITSCRQLGGPPASYPPAAPPTRIPLSDRTPAAPPALPPQAVIILLQHVLGDVPSPPLTGALHDATRNWRKSFAIAMSYLGLAVLLYVAGLGLCVAGRARDFRDEEEEEEERGQSGECGDAVLVRPGVEDVKGRVGHRWAAAGAETEQAEPGRTSSLRQPLSGNAM